MGAVLFAIGFAAQWWNGPIKDWQSAVGWAWGMAFAFVLFEKLAKHIDSLEDRIRVLEGELGVTRERY